MIPRDKIESEILRLTRASGDASIGPSAVAQSLEPQRWRSLLGPVRAAAVILCARGRIDILRKGKPVTPDAVRGVIRLRIRPADPGVPPT